MKVRSLVKVISHEDGGFHLTFFRPLLSLFYAAMSHEHALAVATRFVTDVVQFEGKEWVNSWAGDDEFINCPEGCISLPADIWCCKLSGKACDLQASIDVNDESLFLEKCTANLHKKEQIFNTVKNGRYDGFHHVPGRLHCVSCADKKGKKESFQYHYPWEFAELDVAICNSYKATLAEIQHLELPERYVNAPICASCCRELAIQLRPELEKSLHVIELNYNFREKNV